MAQHGGKAEVKKCQSPVLVSSYIRAQAEFKVQPERELQTQSPAQPWDMKTPRKGLDIQTGQPV